MNSLGGKGNEVNVKLNMPKCKTTSKAKFNKSTDRARREKPQNFVESARLGHRHTDMKETETVLRFAWSERLELVLATCHCHHVEGDDRLLS